ncbi:MAG: divergent polysaccharide deacetylase family protein [Mariprofundaceae bacterium]|nr:divergent polysaccharide deacetylase family protein [Mariprofundaceae bacterium]
MMHQKQTMKGQRGSVVLWVSIGLVLVLGIFLVIYLMPEKVQYLRDATTQAVKESPPASQQAADTYTTSANASLAKKVEPEPTTTAETMPMDDNAQMNAAQDNQPLPQASSSINHADRGLALIMDDVGYGMQAVDTMLAYAIPLTFSILPDAPDAVASANKVYNAGHVVMLHMPMEPKDPDIADKMMTKTGLTSEMNEAQMKAMIKKTLARIPHVTGISNHMGSMLTEQADAMRWLMKINREYGLFFIDSLTTSNSVARVQAAKAGVPWASRRFFLDNDPSPEALGRMWKTILKRAAKKGGCIVIFHPHKSSMAFLKEHIHEADGLLVPLASLLHQPH